MSNSITLSQLQELDFTLEPALREVSNYCNAITKLVDDCAKNDDYILSKSVEDINIYAISSKYSTTINDIWFCCDAVEYNEHELSYAECIEFLQMQKIYIENETKCKSCYFYYTDEAVDLWKMIAQTKMLNKTVGENLVEQPISIKGALIKVVCYNDNQDKANYNITQHFLINIVAGFNRNFLYKDSSGLTIGGVAFKLKDSRLLCGEVQVIGQFEFKVSNLSDSSNTVNLQYNTDIAEKENKIYSVNNTKLRFVNEQFMLMSCRHNKGLRQRVNLVDGKLTQYFVYPKQIDCPCCTSFYKKLLDCVKNIGVIDLLKSLLLFLPYSLLFITIAPVTLAAFICIILLYIVEGFNIKRI